MRRFSSTRPWIVISIFFLLTCYYLLSHSSTPSFAPPQPKSGQFSWHTRVEINSISPSSFRKPPSGKPAKLPLIQPVFSPEVSDSAFKLNNERREAVKATFKRGWAGYREKAWMKDELTPVSGSYRSHFGGWAATLVDSLDTLWIMELKDEFEEAVEALHLIDFGTTEENEINVFETTIRYLGGMLAAYDLSEGKYSLLLQKSLELGDFLYAAFDTPNRMPIMRWSWKDAKDGLFQEAGTGVLLAEIGSLSLEFTRLSQLSGDPKFFDAIQRIYDVFEAQQPLTKLPGMWPMVVNARETNFTDDKTFTFGAMADSTYEYLPKQFMLLGGTSQQPRKMYEAVIATAKSHIIFRPMTPDTSDILMTGTFLVNGPSQYALEPEGQHLSCFVGGMMAIASRIFSKPDDLTIARKLVDGCIWAYDVMPTGIMPELYHTVPCNNPVDCPWDQAAWHHGIMLRNGDVDEANMDEMIEQMRLPPGITSIPDARYILRPEAIESVFILYRITGDESLRESAWDMFQAIEKHTKTGFGNAALFDVTALPPKKADSMEPFWTAETLKYFYLIFSPPNLVSLDEYVFNTEAHPFRRPK